MNVPSEILGIHQSDVIVRTGIMAAFDDLRVNDWLLDYAFASLPNDLMTAAEYGQREIDAAKKWFRGTKIPVMMSTSIVDPSFPVITITLVDSNEAETTLGDVHYVPQQEDERIWPALTPVFAASYGPTTGQVVVPEEIAATLILAAGMQLIDKAGVAHEILEVLDDTVAMIEPGAADFSKTVIKGKPPSSIATLGSVKMKETYAIGCHVQGEQVHLTYLHTLLVFCLYRYKARYFEARGFERHVISSSDFRRNEAFENELTFSRHLNLTGYVPQVWPEDISPKITGVGTSPVIIDGAGRQSEPEDLTWIGEEDALLVGLGIKRKSVFTPAPVPPPAASSSSGMFARWTMEDGTSILTVKDSVGNNHLTAAGNPPALVLGREGALAREFFPDLLDTGALLGSAAANTTESAQQLFLQTDQTGYSIALWLKPHTIPPEWTGEYDFSTMLAVMAPGDETDNSLFWFAYRAPYHQFTIGWGGGFVDSAGAVVDEQWNHLVATYEPNGPEDGTYRLYQNGVKVAEETGWLPPPAQPTAKWQMGGLPDVDASGIHSTGGFPLYGQLDDVRVYSRMLTDQEVAALAAG